MYTLETDLDKLPIAELKRLATLAIKFQVKARVKSQKYYEKHGEKSRERTIRNYALKKAARMEAEQINHETEQ